MIAAAHSQLRLVDFISYAGPGLPIAILAVPLFIHLPTFYGTEIGLDLTSIGIVVLAARIWDAVTDPIIGWASDNTRSRFGRRRFWMVIGTPFLMLASWKLLVPSPEAESTYLLMWSFALYLAWTMVQLPYSAWGAELTSDYHERARVAGWRETAIVIGTVFAAALPAIVEQENGSIAVAMEVLAISVIVLMPVCVLFAILILKDTPAPVSPRIGSNWRQALLIIKGNAPFKRLILAYLLNGLANGLPASLFLLFVSHVLVAPNTQGLLLLVYFLSAIVGIPVWIGIARRTSKHMSWCWSMIFACSVFIWVPFLGSGDVISFLVVCVLSGFALGGDLALPSAIQADVVDVDTAESGIHRTGVYFAFWGVATKLALALAVGISFPLLDSIGFDANAQNSNSALLALSLIYGTLPVMFKVAAIQLMWTFPLGPKAHSELRERIEKLRS